MRTISATLLAEQKKNNYAPAFSITVPDAVDGLTEDLATYLLAYTYREDDRYGSRTEIVLDNSTGMFGEGAHQAASQGDYVLLKRGARIGGTDHLAALPRIWIEGDEFGLNEEGQAIFILHCIDWREKLNLHQPTADTIWTATAADTILSYLVGTVGLTLASGAPTTPVDFAFRSAETALNALNRLADHVGANLVADLSGVIKHRSLPITEEYEMGWNTKHPYKPGISIREDGSKRNTIIVNGQNGATGSAVDSGEVTLRGTRARTITAADLSTNTKCTARAQANLVSYAVQSLSIKFACMPIHGLEILDNAAFDQPTWYWDNPRGMVRSYEETHNRLKGIHQQKIELGRTQTANFAGVQRTDERRQTANEATEATRAGYAPGIIEIVDGVTAPTAVPGRIIVYGDQTDGDLKAVFGDGTVKTITTDT